jgi:hypothetical protein
MTAVLVVIMIIVTVATPQNNEPHQNYLKLLNFHVMGHSIKSYLKNKKIYLVNLESSLIS